MYLDDTFRLAAIIGSASLLVLALVYEILDRVARRKSHSYALLAYTADVQSPKYRRWVILVALLAIGLLSVDCLSQLVR